MIPECQIGTCANPAAFFTSNGVLLCHECASTGRHGKRAFQDCDALAPYVGMPATVCVGSDRHAATVGFVSSRATKITVQMDKSIRTDQNGMSSDQRYDYERDPDGERRDFFRNAAGGYGKSGSGLYVTLGERRSYHDYDF